MQVAMHWNSFNLALVRVRHLKIVPRPEVPLSVTFTVHIPILWISLGLSGLYTANQAFKRYVNKILLPRENM